MDRRKFLQTTAAAASSALLAAQASAAPTPPVTLAPLKVRRSGDRGTADHGWLKAKFSFSFSNYVDRRFMGFRDLRVLNEDRISGGGGFPMHGHQEMEILTYVLDGALQHRDSLGNGGVIKPGLVQRMSAGTGIRHSEFNPSRTKTTHLMQIWIKPRVRRVRPGYAEKQIAAPDPRQPLQLIASPTGSAGSIRMNTTANIYRGLLKATKATKFKIPSRRHMWLQMARGKIVANGKTLSAGDAAFTSTAGLVKMKASEDAEFLLFDLA